MRLDVFLKTSRLIKRRTVAKELSDQGSVLVGGVPAKPGREVRPGDVITLRLPGRTLKACVVDVPQDNVPKSAACGLYKILEDVKREEDAP
ncbi:MAG: RNA-binding S4 domain-containing protein [Nitrospirota bacterium]